MDASGCDDGPFLTTDVLAMSSQGSTFPVVPFSIVPLQQNLRLLELPQDLVDVITSKSRSPALYLKSASPGTQRTHSQPSAQAFAGALHLCSEEKTWVVRQVSTSNSVHVTCCRPSQPGCAPSGEDDPSDQQGSVHGPDIGHEVAAISQVRNILELLEVTVEQTEVEEQIKNHVPIYNGTDFENPGAPFRRRTWTKQDLFNDIPAPNPTIDTAMKRLFLFRWPPSDRSYYQPSENLLLQTWRLLVQTCAIIGIRLDDTRDFQPAIASLEGDGGDGELYASVLKAILHRFLICEHDRPSSFPDDEPQVPAGKFRCEETCAWVGQLVARETGRDVEQLLSEWTDLVPELWASHCSIDVLGNQFEVTEDAYGKERVTWTGGDPTRPKGSSHTLPPPTTSSTSAAHTAKRKWHEKFAAQRNVRK